jgi:hypothetical protein
MSILRTTNSPNPQKIEKVTQIVTTVIQNPFTYNGWEMPVSPIKPLVINSAFYYDPADKSSGINVASCLNQLISGNRLQFIVSNSIFEDCGGDPAKFLMKELEIIYTYNDVTATIICKEMDTVIIQAY